MEILYPDGGRERVKFNQFTDLPDTDPPESVPAGMLTFNGDNTPATRSSGTGRAALSPISTTPAPGSTTGSRAPT
jgi:hypothetical protein